MQPAWELYAKQMLWPWCWGMCCFSNFRSLVVSERLLAPTLDSEPSDVPPPDSEVALDEIEGEGGGV